VNYLAIHRISVYLLDWADELAAVAWTTIWPLGGQGSRSHVIAAE